ncbi:MAG TPA: hypothetical protein GX702_14615, partial [Chloroflexi bacterium]|nr:hypothetical protein [Chloroflexota bacterium]
IVNETEQWYLQLFSPAESVDPVWRDRPALDEDDLVGIANRLVSRVTGVCVRGVTG